MQTAYFREIKRLAHVAGAVKKQRLAHVAGAMKKQRLAHVAGAMEKQRLAHVAGANEEAATRARGLAQIKRPKTSRGMSRTN